MPPGEVSEHIGYREFPVGRESVAGYASSYWQVTVADAYPPGDAGS